jgi:hypothetical protein
MTGRGDTAWLDSLAGTLAEVDESLRTPAGRAALEDYYQARGSIAPAFEAGNLIDAVSFTALSLHARVAGERHP